MQIENKQNNSFEVLLKFLHTQHATSPSPFKRPRTPTRPRALTTSLPGLATHECTSLPLKPRQPMHEGFHLSMASHDQVSEGSQRNKTSGRDTDINHILILTWFSSRNWLMRWQEWESLESAGQWVAGSPGRVSALQS